MITNTSIITMMAIDLNRIWKHWVWSLTNGTNILYNVIIDVNRFGCWQKEHHIIL